MQRRHHIGCRVAELGEHVVLNSFELPKEVRHHGLDLVEIPREMQEEINHVDPLVEQDAAAGAARVGPPTGEIIRLDALAVPPTHPQ